jgi:hypothetical protein
MTSSRPAGWRTALLTVHIVASVGAIGAAESLGDAQRTRVALFPAIALGLLVVNVVLGQSMPRWRLRRVIPKNPVRNTVRNGAQHG